MDKTLVFILSDFEKDEDKELLDQIIKELVKDDKKNKDTSNVYVNPYYSLSYVLDELDEDEKLELSSALLSKCDQIYVLPNYINPYCLQLLGMSKALGLKVTYL